MSWSDVLNYVVANYPELLGSFFAAYEFLVRIFPTVKNYSILNKIIRLLYWIDDKLNNKK
jgi:hypothetical protein